MILGIYCLSRYHYILSEGSRVNFVVDVLEIHNGFHLGQLLCCVMFRYLFVVLPGVKGWLYFSEILDLKLSFCFSALFLKARKQGLELLMEQFAENVRAYVFATSFLLVAFVLFFVRCLRAVGWLFLDIFHLIL